MSGGDVDRVGQGKDALAERYEELRAQVLDMKGGRGLGLALFLGRGMAAWMEAWASCVPEGQSTERPTPPASSGGSLPEGLRGEVALVLAGMALDHEEVRV